ncbi:peptide ABC transporter permease [Shouchella clausii]|uniref:Peptide ABC transporter permease n=1 Tax=Shouchella clausii TaxID=79880 RepID=A0A268P1W1_SHOCL|nr:MULTISPECIES: ABC transporter permease [Shouchella]MCM3313502.1 ABC transporter permease [Psychrobacillus sp. MER TA 17]MCM3382186.1 ABC transporter permease [Shouchella rhizosphaerae]PAE89688.1 peptide ABC transporter permease [Shouchella clausii]GIN06998.1 peptide ABC transporter permease [Shouchella clausii]
MEQHNIRNNMANVEPIKSPSGFQIILKEILRDKLALVSLIFLILVTTFVYGISLFLDQQEIVRVDLLAIFEPPSSQYWLGTDHGGRDVFGQLIIGTRNSLTIGIAVTVLSGLIGLLVGLIAGFYGGHVDNILMRILDFFLILPTTMLIIAFVAIVPNYTIVQFTIIMTAFMWMSMARLIRSKALQQSSLEYIQASKTMGTPNIKIIFGHLLPNLSSIIIVNMTLSLAANIGIESGLSFLGFGFPESTPSLGTLMSHATNPQIFELRPWVWLPASLLVLVLMLCINNVGQALKRATDAKQRRG